LFAWHGRERVGQRRESREGGKTCTSLPQEYVVPRSIPMAIEFTPATQQAAHNSTDSSFILIYMVILKGQKKKETVYVTPNSF
jgi:hypothetical protein